MTPCLLRLDGQPLPLRAAVATTFFARAAGLLGKAGSRAPEALGLEPCAAVHTLFMSAPIDVVFLDRAGRVIGCAAWLRPWSLAYCRGAFAAWELAAGQAERLELAIGRSLGWERVP